MEKIRVAFSPILVDELNALIFTLHQKNYFSELENSFQYIADLISDIELNIALKQHYKTPKKHRNFGDFYCTSKGNKRTTWYVFFKRKNNSFLITTIINNHTAEAKLLIQLK